MNGSCQAHAVVRARAMLKVFVLCPLRAGQFVGADTSSRSCIARYVLGTACYARKSDTFFRIELACLGPRLASAELIRARTDGKTSARSEIFASEKRESRREKAKPSCTVKSRLRCSSTFFSMPHALIALLRMGGAALRQSQARGFHCSGWISGQDGQDHFSGRADVPRVRQQHLRRDPREFRR